MFEKYFSHDIQQLLHVHGGRRGAKTYNFFLDSQVDQLIAVDKYREAVHSGQPLGLNTVLPTH